MPTDVLLPAVQRDVALARQAFLTTAPVAAGPGRLARLRAGERHPAVVRDVIRASWARSRAHDVAADRLALEHVREPELDTPLARGAERVLRHLHDQLEGQPLALVLTDANGLVLSRLVSRSPLERQLDQVRLAPGFSYAESAAGTNGIGTTLEAGCPVFVVGHEHYAEHLEELACAAAPIRDPLSGKTVGVLDLTCWRRDAGSLLAALARTTADQIGQALLADSGQRETDLLHAYLRACRRTGSIVLGVGAAVVMENELAQSALSPDDRAFLVRQGTASLGRRPASLTVELPSGTRVRVHARRVDADDRLGGGVIEARLLAPPDVHAVRATATAPGMLLPGLVGASPQWQRACREAVAAREDGQWLAVAGEPGSGRSALLRGVHQRTRPGTRCTVLDAADAREPGWRTETLRVLHDAEGSIVLRHLEQLDAPALRAVVDGVRAARRRPGAWLGLALEPDYQALDDTGPPARRVGRADLTELLQLFPTTIEVLPLRHHAGDITALVPFLLSRLGRGGALVCGVEAMQVLQRATWPGNVEQLLKVLGQVVQHRRTGEIVPDDLPPELRSLSRRRLSALEALERDAIVASLRDARGDKGEAARALGISRATIYRRIHGYGIVVPV